METLDKNNSGRAPEIYNQSAGWMKFLAILLFIGAGLTILGSFGQMRFMPLMGLVSLITGGVYCVTGVFLLNYANATARYASSGSGDALENMATHHTKYWKLTGILVICVVGLSIIMAVAMMAMYSGYGRYNYFNF